MKKIQCMNKSILFSIYLFSLLILCCSPSYAWQQFGDSSLSDINQNTFSLIHISLVDYDYGKAYKCSAQTGTNSYMSFPGTFTGYMSFVVKGVTVAPKLSVSMYNAGSQKKVDGWNNFITCNADSWHKIEMIENSGKTGVEFYVDGTYQRTITYVGGITGDIASYQIMVLTQSGTGYIYIDDLTTSTGIATPKLINEGTANLSISWSAQLMRGYPNAIYNISLYSISNPANAGKITSWTLAHTTDYGYFSVNRSLVTGLNFGVYMLEMTRDSDVLIDEYFYLDQLSNPQGFPEILFLGESSVKADIRDEDQNGGEIAGEGSVYLYPDVNTNGIYNISYEILETPYSIDTELTKVYNTTAFNGTNFHFSGLGEQNYLVSLDGAVIGTTTGLDTFDYSLTWGAETSHIISFSPDYSLPGIYGYVENSVTQVPIKSAAVAISNSNSSLFLYTDSNGMFYKTQGMEAGNYNVSASKTGYSPSIPFLVQTQAGATTRKDIFLDKVSGDGTYYATHDVTFNVLEYWYSSVGLPGLPYSVTDEAEEVIKEGYTDSKGKFTIEDMKEGTNYTFDITYNNSHHIEYIEPALTEYNIILNKEAEIIHTYYNNWLNLSYSENKGNITLLYDSNKTISAAVLIVKAANGSTFFTESKSTQTGTFNTNLSAGTAGDYIINFNITASDGDTAFQSWAYSKAPKVPLFPDSYPAWLKNTLYVSIIIVFLLAFGKAKNDIACAAAAVLTSFGYYFGWLSCSFYLVVLIWIIALAAVFLHYKRTGALG